MPFGSVKLIPGVNTERTPTLLEAGYANSDLIRWRDGLAQKIGGCERFYPFAVGGTARALWAWQDLNDTDYLAVGTTTLFGAIANNILTDITPQTKTTNFTPKFSTTNGNATVTVDDSNISTITTYDTVYFATPIAVGGVILSGVYQVALVTGTTTYTITAATPATSNVTNGGAVPVFTTASGNAAVTVTLAAHGLAVGDKIVLDISTTVGGITLLGTFTVNTVPTAGTFTITGPNTASSSTSGSMNSGSARIVYYITLGPSATGAGYGIGTYGSGAYGTGVAPSVQVGTAITATDWTFVNWGEIIAGCPEGSGIFTWSPTGGFSTASLIAQGPLFNDGVLISMPAQIMMAWGSTIAHEIGIEQDPLLIRWCDQEDFTVWTDSTTNQAGSFRIPSGSRIVGGVQAAQQTLFWTDLDLWSCSYIGFPLVFNFQQIGSSCGLVAKHARVVFRGGTYWMGRSNFFRFTGSGVEVIACSVWDAVFQDLDTDYLDRCWAWANTPFNEVWFFYPSASGGTGECDSYAKFNVVEGAWDKGSLSRACGIDQSVLGMPIAATSGGLIYSHETGANADGQPIAWSFTTGYFMLAEGEDRVFVDKIIPDGRFGLYNGTTTAQVQITANVVDFPSGTVSTHGPYTFTNTTTDIDTRFRGGLVSFTVEGNDVDSFFRIGRMRYRFSADGRR